jgi:hypothetical protein
LSADDDKLDELLARGSLGGPRYDDILGRVLAQTEARSPRRWLKWSWIPGAAIASAAAWLLLAQPTPGSFTAKGPPTENDALQIGCKPTGGRVCQAGGTLMFSVNSAVTSGVLGAYAERIDDPRHQRIWYFPGASGSAPVVTPGAGTVVVPEGVQIGPEHSPGRYRVTVWLADRPLGAADIDRADPAAIHARTVLDIEVVR